MGILVSEIKEGVVVLLTRRVVSVPVYRECLSRVFLNKGDLLLTVPTPVFVNAATLLSGLIKHVLLAATLHSLDDLLFNDSTLHGWHSQGEGKDLAQLTLGVSDHILVSEEIYRHFLVNRLLNPEVMPEGPGLGILFYVGEPL